VYVTKKQIFLFFYIYDFYFRGNIPGNEIDKGETLCSYLPPFPANGSGWHRCVFLLYKHQNGPINYSDLYGSLPGDRYIYIEKFKFEIILIDFVLVLVLKNVLFLHLIFSINFVHIYDRLV
jgi:hypothetical protein